MCVGIYLLLEVLFKALRVKIFLEIILSSTDSSTVRVVYLRNLRPTKEQGGNCKGYDPERKKTSLSRVHLNVVFL